MKFNEVNAVITEKMEDAFMKKVNKIFAIGLFLIMLVALNGCAKDDTLVVSSEQVITQTEEPNNQTEEIATTEIPEENEIERDIYINTISEEAKEKAKTFPDVSGELPEWKGTHIVDKAEFAWSWVIVETNPENVTPEHLKITEYDEDTVLEIAEAGYNYVRVSVDTRYFFTEDEYQSPQYAGQDFYGSIDTVNFDQYENLDKLIEWCIENDIHVCLDCHSTVGGLMIGGDEETTREKLFTPDSDEQKLFVRFWQIISKRYADIDTNALSFNLYNEPPNIVTDNEDVYINLMNKAIDEIQAITPNRLIIVDALGYSTIGMEKVSELKANNLVIGFHMYVNETTWTEPGAVLDIEACRIESSDRLNYYNSWAEENNVRWMLQEYGCSTYIPQEQQIEYYKMVTETCKSMEVPYCLWAFNAGDFGICIWAEDDKFLTPGASYGETCAGHRINTELVKITTE